MRAAAEAAVEFEEPLILLDQRDLWRADLMLSVDSDGSAGVLNIDGQEIGLDSVSGIYARPLELPRAWRDELSRARAETFHELFVD
jgi:hypothetical protein